MSAPILHDTEEIWRGAGKVLALQLLIDQLMAQMRSAASDYEHAFGTDPEDKASQEGRKQYLPKRDGGIQFCRNLLTMIGLDGAAVNTAGSVLESANEAATDQAGGRAR